MVVPSDTDPCNMFGTPESAVAVYSVGGCPIVSWQLQESKIENSNLKFQNQENQKMTKKKMVATKKTTPAEDWTTKTKISNF